MGQLAEKRMTKCVHFTGIQNTICKAGVRYEDVRGPRIPGSGMFAWPCLTEDLPCDKRLYPTRAQAEQEEAEVLARIEMTAKARRQILAETKGKRGVRGIVACPQCSGNLHYSVAAYNGHIWAKCEHAHCLAWME